MNHFFLCDGKSNDEIVALRSLVLLAPTSPFVDIRTGCLNNFVVFKRSDPCWHSLTIIDRKRSLEFFESCGHKNDKQWSLHVKRISGFVTHHDITDGATT